METKIPRRCYVEKMVPAELKIREAMQCVEELGADTVLTDAVVLLGQAKDKVSDYIDNLPPTSEGPHENKSDLNCVVTRT